MVLSSAINNDLRFNYSQAYAARIYKQDTFGGAKLLPENLVFSSFAKPETSLFYLTIGANDENTISPGTFSANTQNQYNIVDTLSWNTGRHSFKFGFDYRRLAPSIGGRLYSKVLTVPTITQLVSGTIPTAEIRQVDTFLEPRYDNSSVFFQDAWRIAPRLTLTYGMRWELNPAPSEGNNNLPLTVNGLKNPATAKLAAVGSKLYLTTYGNFAPRVGIAYQPFRSRGTVVRGGFGVFYDLGYAFTGTAFTPSNYPYSRNRIVTNASINDPILNAEALPQNANPPYPRLFAYAEDYKLPYTLQFSVAIEQPLGNANSLSASYVGAAARRLARVESFRPQVLQNASFTRIDYVNNEGYSGYNSLQMQFKRRMTRGLQALISYTWSKSLDTASDESITNLQAPVPRLGAECCAAVACGKSTSLFDAVFASRKNRISTFAPTLSISSTPRTLQSDWSADPYQFWTVDADPQYRFRWVESAFPRRRTSVFATVAEGAVLSCFSLVNGRIETKPDYKSSVGYVRGKSDAGLKENKKDMTRRNWIVSSALAAYQLNAQNAAPTVTLPKLPYALDALEPFIDARTMEIHHGKHHQSYVDNLNKALATQPELAKQPLDQLLKNLSSVPDSIRAAVRNSGGGHANHSLFWQTLGKPKGGPAGKLVKAIDKSFGNQAAFEDKLRASGLSVFGSGWVWVVPSGTGGLSIETSPNQDSPWNAGKTPLFGLDVWEHAYYLKYQNRRADYLAAVLKVVNWDFVSARYEDLSK